MLVNCVVYEQGHKLRTIAITEITDYLDRPDCFIWVALRDPDPDELRQMQGMFSLHELAIEDALNDQHRPKIEEYEDMLFVVMKTPEMTDGVLTIGQVAVFVGTNFVLSSRSRSTRGFLGVRARSEREPHLLRHGPGFVLYALMDAVVDRYFPVADALEAELDTIEDQMFVAGARRETIENLYQLKRKVTALKHVVAPLLDASSRLHGGRVPSVCAETREYFRDVTDHLHHIDLSIDGIRETLVTAIQVNLSMVAIEEGEVNKRLAAWAALVAVATVFTGIWGMNFRHMPELDTHYGYAIALALIATVCGYLYRRFRRAGWL